MKAIRFHELGSPDVLALEEMEKPRPGAGEALVKVHVAGVNFADTLLRRGGYAVQTKLPETPGLEAAGVVEEVGEGADAGLAGRRVALIGQKCYAEYTTAPAASLMPLPDEVSFDEGAAFPIQSLTAYHLLFTMDQARPGMTVLDLGAAPGGWTQVAVARVNALGEKKGKAQGRVLGVDLQEVTPIAGAEIHQLDFLDEDADEKVKAWLGGRADVVMSDMAASASGNQQVDHLRIIALCEAAAELAFDVLEEGGTFVAKVLAGGAGPSVPDGPGRYYPGGRGGYDGLAAERRSQVDRTGAGAWFPRLARS